MQYQRLTDDTSIIIGETGESHLWSSSLDTDRNVCRIRKAVLILLLIQLVSRKNVNNNLFKKYYLEFIYHSSDDRCSSFNFREK
jgi:hypothetical protein